MEKQEDPMARIRQENAIAAAARRAASLAIQINHNQDEPEASPAVLIPEVVGRQDISTKKGVPITSV